jgi:hypothetical protein
MKILYDDSKFNSSYLGEAGGGGQKIITALLMQGCKFLFMVQGWKFF